MEIVNGDFQVLNSPVSFRIRPALSPGLFAARDTFQFLGDFACFALHGLRDLVPVRFVQASRALVEHLQPLHQELPHYARRRILVTVLDFLETLTQFLAFALEILSPRSLLVVHQMQLHLDVKRSALEFERFAEDVFHGLFRPRMARAFFVDAALTLFPPFAFLL
jgi:hypothetical protein